MCFAIHQTAKQESRGKARVAEISFHCNKEYLTTNIGRRVESDMEKCRDFQSVLTQPPWVPGASTYGLHTTHRLG